MHDDARHHRAPMTDGAEQADDAFKVPIAYYVAALVAYIGLGLAFKVVFLNWIVGPLFMLFALDVLPRTVRRLRGVVR